jgi:parallel beta-helix repeat protein
VTYTSDGGEVTLRLTLGTVSFAVGDEFTFSTTAGTIVGETLTLTETGADTGIFEGNIELVTGSATASNSKLEVASGDRVTVFYDDPKGDWGTALQVRDEALYAATVIKGSTILQDVVWTKDDSPYLITGDVTISSGRSLTIKEGVKVIFLANSDDTEGGEEKYDSELLVEGSISVLGTAAEPVTFTSSETAPTKGDWGGIKHNQTGVFEHAILEYSGYGIYANNANLTVKNSKINYSGTYGIRGYNNSRTILIEDSEIKGVQSNAIEVWGGYDNSSFTMKRSKITNSNGGGVNIRQNATILFEDNEISGNKSAYFTINDQKGDVSVKGNTWSNNKNGGLNIYDSYQENLNILVEGNSIIEGSGNQVSGISVSSHRAGTEILIQNNTIENRYHGISTYGNYNNTPKILGNTIKGTQQQDTGISVSGKTKATIENNTIENKQYGIRVEYSDANGDGSSVIKGNVIKGNSGYGIRVENYAKPVISLNDIEDNSGYFVDNQTTYTVDARNNWWGETLKAVIESGDNPRALDKFYDQFDDSTKGLVNYAGWLEFSPNSVKTEI